MRFNDARRIFSRPAINGFIDIYKYVNIQFYNYKLATRYMLPLRIFCAHQMIRELRAAAIWHVWFDVGIIFHMVGIGIQNTHFLSRWVFIFHKFFTLASCVRKQNSKCNEIIIAPNVPKKK